MYIDTILTISTAHISEETAEKLETEMCSFDMGLVVYAMDTHEACGWMVMVDSPADGDEEVPEELAALLNFCKENHIDWLRFDRDGEILPGFPVFDWKH